jgi:hypothetical protein
VPMMPLRVKPAAPILAPAAAWERLPREPIDLAEHLVLLHADSNVGLGCTEGINFKSIGNEKEKFRTIPHFEKIEIYSGRHPHDWSCIRDGGQWVWCEARSL